MKGNALDKCTSPIVHIAPFAPFAPSDLSSVQCLNFRVNYRANERASHRQILNCLRSIQNTDGQLSWDAAVKELMLSFSWSAKTSSNRLHEMIDLGLIQREGEYKKGLYGRKPADFRILKFSDEE
jgi:hypothetical protein